MFEVYYLDDEVELCQIVTEYFKLLNVNVTAFSEAEEFINNSNTQAPDLVIIDFRLSDTSGDIVAMKLNENIPKILVTGELTLPNSTLFDVVLSKPFRLKNLESTVFSLLKVDSKDR